VVALVGFLDVLELKVHGLGRPELARGCEFLRQSEEFVVVAAVVEELDAADELDLDAVVLDGLPAGHADGHGPHHGLRRR
jgi:hypothetical protein